MIALPFILNSLFNFVVGILVAKFLGPSQYGSFALALSIAVVLQTLTVDWVRLSATRFYSEQDRLIHPEVRATLDMAFATIACAAIAVAIGIALSGIDLPFSRSIVVLAILTSVANGLFDVSTALVRARFLNAAYARLVIAKNLLSMGLTVGGAWFFGSAKMALVGAILSVTGSIAVTHRALIDRSASPRLADRKLALRYVGYALPIVVANMLYQAVPTTDRAIVSKVHNFAEAGQFAFAFEIGIRIVGAVGSALDVLLFQIAVLTEKTFGAEAARSRVAHNMAIVFAGVAPIVVGCWLVLPSFEHLLVPESFRGPFARYFALMLPAILSFALMNFALAPAFQIAHRTTPLIVAGLVATLANLLAILLLPASPDATIFAIAQSISSCAGLATLIVFLFTLDPMWPGLRDIGGTIAALTGMALCVTPLRTMAPSILALLIQAGIGASVYVVIVLGLDVARLRSLAAARLARDLGNA